MKLQSLHRIQRMQVARVLLQGLQDNYSSLSKLSSIQDDVIKDIIWKKMLNIKKWQFYPEINKTIIDGGVASQ